MRGCSEIEQAVMADARMKRAQTGGDGFCADAASLNRRG